MDLTTRRPTLDAHAEISNASIEHILTALGQTSVPAAGSIGLIARVSGTIAKPDAHLTISASDLQAYGEPLGTLSAEAHIANEAVQLDSLSLDKLDDGRLEASGRYELASSTYAIRANSSKLKVRRLLLSDGTAISADLSLDADSSGTFDNPSGILKLSARDLQVGAQTIGSIDVDANAADHRAQITASAPAYAVTANATIGIVHPYPAEIEVRADTDISRLPQQTKDLSGRVRAILNAHGNLSDISNARVHGEVPSFRINWLNRTITDDGPIDLEYAHREIKISRAAARVEDSSIRLSGNLPLDADATGELQIEGRTNLATLSELIPSKTPVNARGELKLNGSLRGNLKRMNPDATITISDGSIETSMLPAPLIGLNLKDALTDGRVIAKQLDGQSAPAKITGQGEVPFALLPDLPIEIPRPSVPARLSVEVQQFKLSALTQPPQNADATVSLKIEAAASRPEIDAIEALLTFPELRLTAGVYSLEKVGTSKIAVRNGVASFNKFELNDRH